MYLVAYGMTDPLMSTACLMKRVLWEPVDRVRNTAAMVHDMSKKSALHTWVLPAHEQGKELVEVRHRGLPLEHISLGQVVRQHSFQGRCSQRHEGKLGEDDQVHDGPILKQ
jgi:hypothetical protein